MALIPPVERPAPTDAGKPGQPAVSFERPDRHGEAPETLPALDDWPLLGRTERQFLETVSLSMEVTNRTLAELLAEPTTTDKFPLGSGLDQLLEATATVRSTHARALYQLNRRLEIDPNNQLRTTAVDNLLELIEQLSPIDDWRRPPRPTWLLLAIDAIVVGVLGRTSYETSESLLDRNALLPGLAGLFERLRDDVRESLDATQPALRRARASSRDTSSMLRALFDRAVLPCVEMVREHQRRFDCLALGLLPDEMVTDVLDRLFEITERSTPDRQTAEP